MVNERVGFSWNILKEWHEDISNRQQLPFMKKAITWFGSVRDFWNGPGNDWIVLAESEYEWQGIIMVAEAPVNVSGLLGKGDWVSITWWLAGCSIHCS